MKIALIGGYGHQGLVFGGMARLEDCRLTAVAASEPGEDMSPLLAAVDKVLGCRPAVYDDWQTMLDREQPDVVGVSPMFCHHERISVACLRRGIHAMCEKPVALTLEELAELKEVHARSGVQFIGMHSMRYEPNFRAGCEALRAGLIGRPIQIVSQKSYAFSLQRPPFYKDRRKFGGTLAWVAIHALDWTYWMMGGLNTLFAAHTTLGNMGYGECESSGVIAFTFKNGGQGAINFDFLKAHKDPNRQDRTRISGERGVIEIACDRAVLLTHDAEPRELELKPPDFLFADFVNSIRGHGSCLLNAEDTFEVTRLALLARESADTGQVMRA